MGDELCDIRQYSAPRRLVASAMQEVYGQRKNKPQPSNNFAICLNGSDSSLGSNIVLVTMASKPIPALTFSQSDLPASLLSRETDILDITMAHDEHISILA